MGRKKKTAQKMDTSPFGVKKGVGRKEKRKKKRKKKKKKVASGEREMTVDEVLLAVTKSSGTERGRQGAGEERQELQKVSQTTEEAVNETIVQLARALSL